MSEPFGVKTRDHEPVRAESRATSGLAGIAAAFARAREAGRAALMPYYTLGYPDAETGFEVLRAIAQAGADLIELGVPFSDPLADGPTIQRSTQGALAAGMTVRRCLEMAGRLRGAGVEQPLLLMGYVNPILAYGVQRYVSDATAAGADGFIVPDLPPEEGGELEAACREYGCALVYLLAPTASAGRAAQVAAHASGFLYLVSVAGVTGARRDLAAEVPAFIARARASAGALPVALGFGISSPEQAATAGRLADGVIVGSALIDAVDRGPDPVKAAAAFVAGLRAALEPGSRRERSAA